MSNRGTPAEHEARDILAKLGYFVMRAPGSAVRGKAREGEDRRRPVDLLAVYRGGRPLLFVQVKQGAANSMRPPDWNRLLSLAELYGAVPVLAERKPRKPMAFWRMTGPKTEGHSTNVQPRAPFDPADLDRLRMVSGIDPRGW